MKLHTRSSKGFTLVEIMIVVVIIGLLAAMAIPAFQKVRQNSIEKTLTNDARQLAGAANQIYMETGVSSIAIGLDGSSNVTLTPLASYVSKISVGNIFPSQLNAGATFTASNAALPSSANVLSFTADGQKL